MTEQPTKPCKACCKEIAAGAKKCPYCHQWQGTLFMIWFHPAGSAVFAALVVIAVFVPMGLILHQMFEPGQKFQEYASQVEIAETKMEFGDGDRGQTVAVVGLIKNESAVDWKDIHIQVEFKDNAGNLIDVGQEELYSYYLPAHTAASFKVSFGREFPVQSYATHSIRIIAAKDAGARF